MMQLTKLQMREFLSISRILTEVGMYDPATINLFKRIIAAPTSTKAGDAFIIINLSTKIVKPDLTFSINYCRDDIKELKNIRDGKNVNLSYNAESSEYRFIGDHYEVAFESADEDAWEEYESIPEQIKWVGVPVDQYRPDSLKRFLGRHANKTHLAIYDDQIEQVASNNALGFYTFTKGMKEKLKGLTPDHELISRVAFRRIGKNHSIRLGRLGDSYVLHAKSEIDLETTIDLYEILEEAID